MPQLGASDFEHIFRKRRDCSVALLEQSRRQRSLIRDDNFEQLLEVLGIKQNLLNTLDVLGRKHPDLMVQWRSFRASAAHATRKLCEELLAEAEATLAELLHEENASTDELTVRRDGTQRELRGLSQGSRVHDAYRTVLAPATHRHLDVGQ